MTATDSRILIKEMRRLGRKSEWLGYTDEGSQIHFRYANGRLTAEENDEVVVDRQIGGPGATYLNYSLLRRFAAADRYILPEHEYVVPWLRKILHWSWS